MTLRARLAAILVLAVAAALLAGAWIAERAGRQVRAEIEQAREGYVLETLRLAAENHLATGLALEQMAVLQSLIEREKAGAPRVVAIDVYSAGGVLVFSTDRGMVGSQVALEWVQQLRQPLPWRQERGGEHVVGARFDNDLGQPVGGIALTVAGDPPWTLPPWLPLAAETGLALLALCALAALAAVAAMRLLLRPYADAASVLAAEPPARSAAAGGVAAAAQATRQAWEAGAQRAREGVARLREIDDAG